MSTSTAPIATLAISLGEVHVGDLALLADDVTEFRLNDAYRAMVRRPVLGQAFEDDLSATHRSRMALPPFFSNLLPEGLLREVLASRLKVPAVREFFLLEALGQDLPGAIRATATRALPSELAPVESFEESQDGPLKFSLAGVQLKLSMVREGKGLTLPVSGRGGDWIVKLPGSKFQRVAENEFSTMQWAGLVGIDVPVVELVATRDLAGLPPDVEPGSGQALAIRRFDRPTPLTRIHQEDFAQVRGVYPAAKYGGSNYETLGKIILHTAGRADFDEFVRRLAFILVTANADAHVKNWSLRYPDGVNARLAPAYDLVSTIEFLHPDKLALNFAKTKDWSHFSLERFAEFGKRVGVEPGAVTDIVREVVVSAMDHWPTVRSNYPVSALLTERLEQHWKVLPLVAEARR
jgi:serine/threonine-protein kinase HipA